LSGDKPVQNPHAVHRGGLDRHDNVRAFAGKRADPQTLPGVNNDYRIVKPPVSEPNAEPPSTIKAGGWEVSVSGTFTVDVTTGNLPLPRH